MAANNDVVQQMRDRERAEMMRHHEGEVLTVRGAEDCNACKGVDGAPHTCRLDAPNVGYDVSPEGRAARLAELGIRSLRGRS